MRAGEYKGWLPTLFVGQLLQGATVGIVGAGRIGAAYARMARRNACSHARTLAHARDTRTRKRIANRTFLVFLRFLRHALATPDGGRAQDESAVL
jgi:lactate dehydrogenase-like 2-hydroxyacid dehydrogenase